MGFILGRVWTRYPVGELRSPMPYGLAKKKITTTKIIRRESGLKGLMRPSLFALPLPFSQRRQWHPSPGLLPGKPHGGRSLVAAVHGVAKSRMRLSDFTLTFHFHALEKEMATHSCSCLENPRDGGAWWAAVCGVAESDTTEAT